jgi:hypothetical protein
MHYKNVQKLFVFLLEQLSHIHILWFFYVLMVKVRIEVKAAVKTPTIPNIEIFD